MSENFSQTSFLLTNFLHEGAGISPDVRKQASALSIELSRFMLQSPILPATMEDVLRIKRVPHLVHFAAESEYEGFVEKYMVKAEKKALPVDSLLTSALNRGSQYNGPESEHDSTGLTIFPHGSNEATAVIIRKPDESTISVNHFLNVLSEEMVHAAAPQATFLKEAQRLFPHSKMTPLDFFELVGRWVKFEFLEKYNPALILPEEHDLLEAKKELGKQGTDFDAFKNLYLRGIYKAV
ncbi:MAG: hypothetical protein NTV98_02380 [Candidatus Roizmanbacteria bacterium]|nr:hypothetical protein [Candidatus Roizmanbacteria bacterium]